MADIKYKNVAELPVLAAATGNTHVIVEDYGEFKRMKGDTLGKTPVKGVDYWTSSDKAEIVEEVIAALPNGDEVSY